MIPNAWTNETIEQTPWGGLISDTVKTWDDPTVLWDDPLVFWDGYIAARKKDTNDTDWDNSTINTTSWDSE